MKIKLLPKFNLRNVSYDVSIYYNAINKSTSLVLIPGMSQLFIRSFSETNIDLFILSNNLALICADLYFSIFLSSHINNLPNSLEKFVDDYYALTKHVYFSTENYFSKSMIITHSSLCFLGISLFNKYNDIYSKIILIAPVVSDPNFPELEDARNKMLEKELCKQKQYRNNITEFESNENFSFSNYYNQVLLPLGVFLSDSVSHRELMVRIKKEMKQVNDKAVLTYFSTLIGLSLHEFLLPDLINRVLIVIGQMDFIAPSILFDTPHYSNYQSQIRRIPDAGHYPYAENYGSFSEKVTDFFCKKENVLLLEKNGFFSQPSSNSNNVSVEDHNLNKIARL